MTQKTKPVTKGKTTQVTIKDEVVNMERLPERQMANSIDMANGLEEKRRFAVEMIKSGLLPATLASPDHLEDDDLRDKAIGAVIAVVEYGREIQITPWVALHGMHVVQGKVVMGIHMYMGLALKNNILVNVTRDYVKIYNKDKKLVDIETTVVITRKHDAFGDLVRDYTFTKRWSEIKKAGSDGRDNYQKRPTTMLRTRCITEALRLYAADIFMGTLETTEMIDVQNLAYSVDEEGEVVYAEAKQ